MSRSSHQREFLKTGAAIGIGSWIASLADAQKEGSVNQLPSTSAANEVCGVSSNSNENISEQYILGVAEAIQKVARRYVVHQ